MTWNVPLRVRPRLDTKLWGGQRLVGLGFPAAADGQPLGEALLTHGDATVALPSRAGQGQSLAQLVNEAPMAWVGRLGADVTGDRSCFPLLAKLIDAGDDLSIQVHPDDAAAREMGEPVGKTEAWHVLAAAPDAWLYLGLAPGVAMADFVAALADPGADVGRFLRRVPAQPGTTVLLPAGTVHALGRGVLLYEIQQPSMVTFRLHDWHRTDAAGRSRELHLEAALRVLNPDLRPEPIAPLAMPTISGQRQLLVATRLFALERIALHVGEPLILPADESPQVVTCIGGAFRLDGRAGGVDLQVADTAIAPTGTLLRLAAVMPGVVMRAWVPDLRRDVVRPARDAGASDEAIAALASSLPDLAEVL